jgi:hypothetical protein
MLNYPQPVYSDEVLSDIQLTSQEQEITFEEAQEIVFTNLSKFEDDDELPF